MQVRAVAFDLMDTLVHDPFREALEAATGRPLRDLFALRDTSAYPRFERSEITEQAYWATYAAAGIDVDPDTFHEVRRERTRWLPGMRDLVAEVRAAGHVVAIASNYPTWIEELATDILDGCHDVVYASCHVGVRKPDLDFYVGLVARLGLAPSRIAFVDDREVNVAAARQVGMPAIVASGHEVARGALVDLGVL